MVLEYLPTLSYIYPKNDPNVGKYSSTMEHLGNESQMPSTSHGPTESSYVM